MRNVVISKVQSETRAQDVLVNSLAGINEGLNDKAEEFATLQNVFPQDVGLHARVFGKLVKGKEDGSIFGLQQVFLAQGYSQLIIQTVDEIMVTSEGAPNLAMRIVIWDYRLGHLAFSFDSIDITFDAIDYTFDEVP